MTVIRWDPFREFLNIQNEVGRVFERTFGEGGEQPRGGWVPAVDVYEHEDAITIKADLPELTAADIEVAFEDDRLVLSGERKFKEEIKEDQYYRLERRYGTFRRVIPLPADAIKPEEITADFSDGVLKVVVPKAEDEKPKQIKIEVGEKTGA